MPVLLLYYILLVIIMFECPRRQEDEDASKMKFIFPAEDVIVRDNENSRNAWIIDGFLRWRQELVEGKKGG